MNYNEFIEVIGKISERVSYSKIGLEKLELSYNARVKYPFYFKFESFCINLHKLCS